MVNTCGAETARKMTLLEILAPGNERDPHDQGQAQIARLPGYRVIPES